MSRFNSVIHARSVRPSQSSVSRYKTNAERSVLSRLFLVLLVVGSVGVLGGCDLPSGGGTIALPVGTWESSSGDQYTITTRSISYDSGYGGSYSAQIVSVHEGEFNAGDGVITSGGSAVTDPGYAVIQYTSVSDASYGAVGKFNIFRWADGTSGDVSRLMTQGGKYNDDYSEMYVFNSATAAVEGATNADGYFSYAGEYNLQE